jgi:hypothetical protein
VEGCDHHCQWVNNCVGHRNYTSFFAFLTSAVLTLALVIVTSAIHLAITARQEGFKHAVNHGAGSAVAFSLGILVIWPITALAVYHIRLLLLNVTTIEQVRAKYLGHIPALFGPLVDLRASFNYADSTLDQEHCAQDSRAWSGPTESVLAWLVAMEFGERVVPTCGLLLVGCSCTCNGG